MFIAIEFHEETLAYSVAKKLLEHGVILKPTHKNILKLTPALILTQTQIEELSQIFQKSWNEVE